MLKFEETSEGFVSVVTGEHKDCVGELIKMGEEWMFWPYRDGFTMNNLTQINDKLYRLNHEVVVDANLRT
jgi:hypothetical protein